MTARTSPPLEPPIPGAADTVNRRRWWSGLLALVVLIPIAAVIGWYWRTPFQPSSTVVAVLRVGALPSAASTPTPDKADLRREEIYRQTQAGLLRTRVVLERAVAQAMQQDLSIVHEQPQPVSWLEKELQIETREATKTIRVSLSGDRPEQRAQLVNAVVHAYLAEFVETENREQYERLARCERLVREQTGQLNRQMADFQKLCQQLGGDTRASRFQYDMALERSLTIQQELEGKTAQLDKARLQLELERKKQAVNGGELVPESMIDEQLARDPQAAQLAAQVVRTSRTIAAYEESARGGPDASPLVKSLLKGYHADLAAAQQQLVRLRAEIRARLAKQLIKASQGRAKELEEQIGSQSKEQKELRQKLQNEVKTQTTGGRSWTDLDPLFQDIERKLESVRKFSESCDLIRQEIQTRSQVVLILEARWPP